MCILHQSVQDNEKGNRGTARFFDTDENLALAFYLSFGYYEPILNGGQSPATFLAGKLPGNQRRR